MSLFNFSTDADCRMHYVGPTFIPSQLIIGLLRHLNVGYSLANGVTCSLDVRAYNIIVRTSRLCVFSGFISCLPLY